MQKNNIMLNLSVACDRFDGILCPVYMVGVGYAVDKCVEHST